MGCEDEAFSGLSSYESGPDDDIVDSSEQENDDGPVDKGVEYDNKMGGVPYSENEDGKIYLEVG